MVVKSLKTVGGLKYIVKYITYSPKRMNFIFTERSEQMANNKVYSRAEMQEAGIVTYDYAFMTEAGNISERLK